MAFIFLFTSQFTVLIGPLILITSPITSHHNDGWWQFDVVYPSPVVRMMINDDIIFVVVVLFTVFLSNTTFIMIAALNIRFCTLSMLDWCKNWKVKRNFEHFFWRGGLYVFLTPTQLPRVPLVQFRVCPLTP